MNIYKSLNDYSLDATLVMAVWLGLLSYWFSVNLPWWLYPWVASLTWIAYTWDRLIDSYLQPDLINSTAKQLFSIRHAKHKKHQKVIFYTQGVLTPLVLWGFVALPNKFWSFIPLMGLLCLSYIGLTYLNKKYFNTIISLGRAKHLMASMILCLGLVTLVNSYSTDNLCNYSKLTVLAVIIYLFWTNMRCCEYWDTSNPKLQTKYYLSLEIVFSLLFILFAYIFKANSLTINLPLSFILIIIMTLGSYIYLLLSSDIWMKPYRLYLADMSLIAYPLVILALF